MDDYRGGCLRVFPTDTFAIIHSYLTQEDRSRLGGSSTDLCEVLGGLGELRDARDAFYMLLEWVADSEEEEARQVDAERAIDMQELYDDLVERGTPPPTAAHRLAFVDLIDLIDLDESDDY